ncbi:MAG: DUF1905 domain-containing protein [Flavobacteriales bacterium]
MAPVASAPGVDLEHGQETRPQDLRFTAPLEKMNAKMAFHFVEVPFDVEKEFGLAARGQGGGHGERRAGDRALLPQKSGMHIIILGGDIRRPMKLRKEGDMAVVEIREHPDPEKLDLPEELAGDAGLPARNEGRLGNA